MVVNGPKCLLQVLLRHGLGAATLTQVKQDVTSLRIHNVTKEDTSTFLCVASNNISSTLQRKARLIVKYPLDTDRSPHLGKAATVIGGTGTVHPPETDRGKASAVIISGV